MKQTILISGINSFVGSHLVDYILQNHQDVEIHGTARLSSKLDNIQHTLKYLQPHTCDLLDKNSVDKVIDTIKPDKLFHLAAQSNIVFSSRYPQATLENNIVGQCNLFEAVRKYSKDTKILCCGSSEQYGAVLQSDLPATEETLLRPLSPYAVSKAACDLMGFQYFKSYNLGVIRARAFNHSGAKRPADFVDSGFAKQIAEIEIGLREPIIKHGNLEVIRDFTHVKDIVRAYWFALDGKCEAGETYNICSERGIKIYDVLVSLLTMTKVDVKTEIDKTRLRQADVPVLIGDCSKFKQATDWKSELSYEQALEDMLDFWRQKLKKI